MDGKKLEIFMTAVDLGSFSKASDVVGYTQSGLTHLMDRLEYEIGFPLLNRTHAGVSLTEEGEKLMPAIRDFIRANATLENRIEEISQHKIRTIRIAAYASIAMQWMPEILYRFRRACPEASVDLRMVDNALEPFELLEQGKADVIFASKHAGFDCDWITLYKEPLFAILPKNSSVKTKTFPLKKFEGKDFLMPYGRFDLDVQRAMKKAGVKLNWTPAYVDDETVIRMVSKGLGVTMMSELMIRGRTDDVICLPVSPEAHRELGLGLPKGTNASTKYTTEISILKNCVAEFLKEKI